MCNRIYLVPTTTTLFSSRTPTTYTSKRPTYDTCVGRGLVGHGRALTQGAAGRSVGQVHAATAAATSDPRHASTQLD